MATALHALPGWLEPVLAFVNTVDVETGVDELAGGPDALSRWLTARDTRAEPSPDRRGKTRPAPAPRPRSAAVAVTGADYRLALDLRTGLRALALQNNGVPADPEAIAQLRRALDRLPFVAEVPAGAVGTTEGGPGSARRSSPRSADPLPAGNLASPLHPYKPTPARAALGVIVAGYVRASCTGDWSRLRRCPAEDCAWVFWDSSAKGARRWCTMSVCGNRAKARAFAERRSRGQVSAH